MTDPQIERIKRQIADLTDELYRLEKKSKSIWNVIHQAFVSEGNPDDIAELWADRISEIMISWANNKRSQLGEKIIEAGEMPPYSQCLNDLIVDVSPPGSQPPGVLEMAELTQIQAQGGIAEPVPPQPPILGLGGSPETSVVPKMQRVYVPKPFSEMNLN